MRSSTRVDRAGFTLIETLFASGVMVIGIVLVMQAIISVALYGRVGQMKLDAKHFSASVLESMRGRDGSEILRFNRDFAEFDAPYGKVVIQGVGEARVRIEALIPDGAGTSQLRELPLSDDEIEALPTLPNPLEVSVDVVVEGVSGGGPELRFHTSSLILHSV